MRNLLLTLVITFTICCSHAFANLFLDEHFNYATTADFQSSGWRFDSIAGSEQLSNIEISAGSLNRNFISPPSGNKLSFSGNWQAAAMEFTPQTNTFMSAIVQFNNLGNISNTPSSLLYLGQRNVGAGTHLWVKSNGSQYNLGISKYDQVVSWSSSSYNYNTPLFVVLNYTSVAGSGNDVAQGWFYDSNQTDSAWGTDNFGQPSAYTNLDGGGDVSINQLVLDWNPLVTSQRSPSYFLDEIRVGNSFAEVTPFSIPEPSAFALSLFLAIGLGGYKFLQKRKKQLRVR